jgi:hypothetical protein
MDKFRLLEQFIKEFLIKVGFEEEANKFKLTEDDSGCQISSDILQKINDFLYVTDPACEKNPDNNKDFISKFHEFWRKQHQNIINPLIDEEKCLEVARVLEKIHSDYSSQIVSTKMALFTPGNIADLTPQQIANVRFFTITQDFKIRFNVDPYPLALTKPHLFDAKAICANYPASTDELLDKLGADTQTDKRHKFSRLSAEFIIEKYNGDAFDICQVHGNNVLEVRKALVDNPDARFKGQLGFSDKKANLLIRDLVAMGVWRVNNPEEIDVSSDANTMRIALRTGILRVRAPLLTSYLDVYGYQYGLIDNCTKLAWRKVWEIWGTLPSNHRVEAPAMFDFLIYRIGQNCCKPKTRRCETQCSSQRLEKCELGENILANCSGKCAFTGICGSETKELNPPRAISILGGTGWEDGRTTAEGGGKGISA